MSWATVYDILMCLCILQIPMLAVMKMLNQERMEKLFDIFVFLFLMQLLI